MAAYSSSVMPAGSSSTGGRTGNSSRNFSSFSHRARVSATKR